jgi:hypothetical protein
MTRRSKASSVSTLQPDLFVFGMSSQPATVVCDRDATPVNADARCDEGRGSPCSK